MTREGGLGGMLRRLLGKKAGQEGSADQAPPARAKAPTPPREAAAAKAGGSWDPAFPTSAKAPGGDLTAPREAAPTFRQLRELQLLEPAEGAGEALGELLRRQRRFIGNAQDFGEEL